MNKTLLAGVLLLIAVGMTGSVAAQQADEDERLNSIYAYDDAGDFYVVLFTEDATHTYGTVDSFAELDAETAEICQQWVEREEAGWFGLLGEDRVVTSVECQDMETLDEVPDIPQPEQPEPETPEEEMNDEEMMPEEEEMNEQDQMQQEEPMEQETADLFYAYDEQGEYMALELEQDQVVETFGTVEDIQQLDQETLVACEVFAQQEEPECYSYDELQQQVEQGEIEYLELEPEVEEEPAPPEEEPEDDEMNEEENGLIPGV